MKPSSFKTIEDVAFWRLCMGCGACAYGCPNQAIEMLNLPQYGIRPRIDATRCEACGTCLNYCPGIALERLEKQPEHNPILWNEWGPVRSLWEGYAGDPEIRYLGSSGGMATALSLYCLEQEAAAGVFHIRENPDNPLENQGMISRDRSDLVKATGSRYCPAALCGDLKKLEAMDGPCVVVGKPCDIEALHKACEQVPGLREKVFLTISIFCAGTPALEGTLKALAAMGVQREQVESLRYRGCGWPGMMTAQCRDGAACRPLSYEQAWGQILSRHGQWRCRLCPDPTGEFADISCGDPWYQVPDGVDPGRSLILARTDRGEQILKKARDREYAVIQPSSGEEVLYRSQPSLHRRIRHLWGRLWSMRLSGVPRPHYGGFPLFKNWSRLPVKEKVKSIAGTLKRILVRRYNRPESDLYEHGGEKGIAAVCRE